MNQVDLNMHMVEYYREFSKLYKKLNVCDIDI